MKIKNSFRPQQGLTIMNTNDIQRMATEEAISFRPQQGLTIMNYINLIQDVEHLSVSVPNRGYLL